MDSLQSPGLTSQSAAEPPLGFDQAPERRMLRLDEIVVDAGTQVRAEISEKVVEDYAESLGEGTVFPPVVVFSDGSSCWLADGFHRLRAFRRAGREEIEADVYAGSLDDALWFALGANRTHGERLSRGDKRHAIELAFRTWPALSQVRVARQVGCHQSYVCKVRGQGMTSHTLPDRVVGQDGKSYPARCPAPASPLSSGSGAGVSVPEFVPETVAGPALSPEAVPASDPSVQDLADPALDEGSNSAFEPSVGEGQPSSDSASPFPSGKQPSQRSRNRSNRLVSVLASEAKQLLAQEELIDFAALDRSMLSAWIGDLEQGQRDLARLIQRLKQEVVRGQA